ncbi:Putative secreted protein [Sphingopyxis fribergensis]|uniref:Putative secreted protein n=1 Tax=Sphingopyxis fribergensis TaxID=1515612 RepID=A0A0A7PMD6_9SPHN|nr:hypothetical protein [Sphingopyxis fribergensis]AJA09092.1 Putative secreted protein [Sphingopyxis fribergensis]
MEHPVRKASAERIVARLLLSGALLHLTACGQPTAETPDQATKTAASDPAAAKQTSRPLPRHILAWAANMRRECLSVGGTPQLTSEPVPQLVADFNSDRKEDFLIPDGFMQCDGALTYFTSGQVPNYTIFVSTEKGHDETGISSLDVSAAKFSGRDVLILSTGGPGAYERPYDRYAFGWDGKKMAPLAFYDAKGGRVNEDGSPWRSGAAISTAFPPIPKGYYAANMSCARAHSAQAASDGPASLVQFDDSALTWFDGGPEIRGFESLGNNRFRIRARSYGNGDDTKGTSADFVIRVTGASTFVTEPGSFLFDGQESFIHCPTNTVPKAVRDWFEG